MKKVSVKENLKKQINDIIADLRLNCNNGELFDKQMEKLMSKKSQLDVEPAEIIVKSEDVLDHINMGAYGLTRTKNEIIFETNGYRIVVKPWVERLYTILNFICDVKSKGKKASKDDTKMCDTLLPIVVVFMMLPLNGFIDDKMTADIYKSILVSFDEAVKKIGNADLQEETEVKDNEFKKGVEVFEDFKKEVK